MSLYSQLGGDAAIAAALDRFYVKVLDDPEVARYFQRVDVERVKAQQRAFLAMAFGGPAEYDGRDLRAAHAAARKLGLDDDGYDSFMGHFEDTLTELGVPDELIGEVMAIAHSGKDEVLGR